ncbi:ABC transporter ATP-binding protein [Peptostreptococcus porci]
MSEREIVVKVEDMTMAYSDTPVIWDVDVDFVSGSITAIIGPNGAGKSTLLKGMLNLMKPITGSTYFWGKEFREIRNKVAYVPQKESVNWDFPISVLDVVMMGRYAGRGIIHRVSRSDREKAMNSLREMKMEKFADRHISDLSGGQKQRVFIARAINQDADLYIMDEPLAGVDKNTEQIIMEKFKEFQKNGKTVIVVHHDMNTLMEYFDHVVVVDKVIKGQGLCSEVFKDVTPMEWMTRRK